MTLYWRNNLGQLYLGDSLEELKRIGAGSVDTCITSPPYWMKRNYGGGNEIGQEPDYRKYLDNVCAVFSEIYRILKPTGNLFVVIGDSYYSRQKGTGGKTKKQLTNTGSFFEAPKIPKLMLDGALMNLPSRFAIKMVDEYDWILKHDIIWHKPNAFVTSNKKKFTFDYEHIYHFVLDTKKYYFEQQFEPFSEETIKTYEKKIEKLENELWEEENVLPEYRHNKFRITSQESPNRMWTDLQSLKRQLKQGRIKRSVWNIPTTKYRGSHSATYPKELVEILLKAGCPEGGTVIDPFLGAGTTVLVAQQQNKKWIGIEIYEQYCKDAMERIKNE